MGRGATVYVGNLPEGCRSSELEGLFEKYGRISRVDIKGDPSRGALFGFVEFDSSRDAEDAVDARDGYKFDGNRLRVELSKGGGPRASRGSFRGRESPAFLGRGKGYKIEISSLPRDASWQDLRDNFGGVGKILFADVDRRGGGFLEFAYEDDVKRCIDKFDDTKFTSRSGESNYIRLKAGRDSHSQRRSRSCSPARRGRIRSPRRSPVRRGRSRSPRRSYSPMRRGRSRSRSYSPARRDRSRSRSITPDRKDRSRSITPRRSLSPARRRSPSPDRKDRGRSRSPDRRRSRSPRRSVSSAHSRSRSHSPIKKDRSRRSASPSGDNRKRSRSPLSKASRSRNRSIDSRSPPPSKKPRSASNSPCGSVSPQRDSQRG